MDFKLAIAFAVPIGLGIAAVGTALGLGRAVAAAMDAIGRQPEASNKILTNMVVGCAFIEAIMIYMLVYGLPTSGNEAILLLLGALQTAWGGIIAFYFGSSSGSQKKDAMIYNSKPLD